MALEGNMALGTTLLKFSACSTAIYLLIHHSSNWSILNLIATLVPYIFISFPAALYSVLSGWFGKWVTFGMVLVQLFSPHDAPDSFQVIKHLTFLLVVAPVFVADNLRDGPFGVFICLVSACYMLPMQIRLSHDSRGYHSRRHETWNIFAVLLLLFYPWWRLMHFYQEC